MGPFSDRGYAEAKAEGFRAEKAGANGDREDMNAGRIISLSSAKGGGTLSRRHRPSTSLTVVRCWKRYKVKSVADLASEPIDKTLYLLGDEWLERGSGGIISAGSGIGKSVLAMQMEILWGVVGMALELPVPVVR